MTNLVFQIMRFQGLISEILRALTLLPTGGGGGGHRRKSSNEILPGVDLQTLPLIEKVVWCFAFQFVCRVFIGKCRWLVLVMGSFFKSMTSRSKTTRLEVLK